LAELNALSCLPFAHLLGRCAPLVKVVGSKVNGLVELTILSGLRFQSILVGIRYLKAVQLWYWLAWDLHSWLTSYGVTLVDGISDAAIRTFESGIPMRFRFRLRNFELRTVESISYFLFNTLAAVQLHFVWLIIVTAKRLVIFFRVVLVNGEYGIWMSLNCITAPGSLFSLITICINILIHGSRNTVDLAWEISFQLVLLVVEFVEVLADVVALYHVWVNDKAWFFVVGQSLKNARFHLFSQHLLTRRILGYWI